MGAHRRPDPGGIPGAVEPSITVANASAKYPTAGTEPYRVVAAQCGAIGVGDRAPNPAVTL